MKKGIIGVDIGGTNTVIGLFQEDLTLIEKKSIPTLKPNLPEKTNNPKEYLDVLAKEIKELAEKNGYENQIQCVGIGVPGLVNPDQGVVINAVNLGYDHVPFAKFMSERLNGIPVFIDNDVRTYTRGEAQQGAGKGSKNIICLTLGTGMAAGIMVNGEMITGSEFFAGELGHDYVPGNETPCNCGKVGCVETIASATGISRLAKEAVNNNKETILAEIDGEITSKDVYEASQKGDKVALEIFDYVGRTLGFKLLTTTVLLNPEVIIIGGGVAAAGKLITEPIERVLKEYYFNTTIPEIKIGELGDSAGLIGAATLAKAKI